MSEEQKINNLKSFFNNYRITKREFMPLFKKNRPQDVNLITFDNDNKRQNNLLDTVIVQLYLENFMQRDKRKVHSLISVFSFLVEQGAVIENNIINNQVSSFHFWISTLTNNKSSVNTNLIDCHKKFKENIKNNKTKLYIENYKKELENLITSRNFSYITGKILYSYYSESPSINQEEAAFVFLSLLNKKIEKDTKKYINNIINKQDFIMLLKKDKGDLFKENKKSFPESERINKQKEFLVVNRLQALFFLTPEIDSFYLSQEIRNLHQSEKENCFVSNMNSDSQNKILDILNKSLGLIKRENIKKEATEIMSILIKQEYQPEKKKFKKKGIL